MKRSLSIIMCILLLCLCVCGCSGKLASPNKVLSGKLKEFQKGNLAAFSVSGKDVKYDKEMVKALYDRMEYDIKDTEIKGDKAVVTVSITTINMASVFKTYVKEAFRHADDKGWDKDFKGLKAIMKDENTETIEKEVEVSMTKTKKGWEVDSENTSLYNALTGGLYSVSSMMNGDS